MRKKDRKRDREKDNIKERECSSQIIDGGRSSMPRRKLEKMKRSTNEPADRKVNKALENFRVTHFSQSIDQSLFFPRASVIP
jgi:hypothetical protein